MKHKKKVDAKCILFSGLKNVLHIVLFSQQAQTFHFQRLIQRLNSSATLRIYSNVRVVEANADSKAGGGHKGLNT